MTSEIARVDSQWIFVPKVWEKCRDARVSSERASYLDVLKQRIAAAAESETDTNKDLYGLEVLVRHLSIRVEERTEICWQKIFELTYLSLLSFNVHSCEANAAFLTHGSDFLVTQDVTKITKYPRVELFVTSFKTVPVLWTLKKLGYVAVECIQLAQDKDPWRAVVKSMKNLEAEFFPFWTVMLRQWIIGSRRFGATYCRHLQILLGYFEHWRWEYYLALTGRDPITH
jgi:hypothetical protein